eukprot:scaffold137683_cov23-Tisochrysis_lutea.AAC.1
MDQHLLAATDLALMVGSHLVLVGCARTHVCAGTCPDIASSETAPASGQRQLLFTTAAVRSACALVTCAGQL